MPTPEKPIMVVDDDEELLGELEEALRLSGYSPLIFSNAEEALEAVPRLRPSVILLDIKMRGLNGFQITDRLNQSPRTAHIPIVVMTGYFLKEEHLRLMSMLGVRSWIKKPFKLSDVVEQIKKFEVSAKEKGVYR